MTFAELLEFLQGGMRMSHIYQPIMIRHLLENSGRNPVEQIARALLVEDRSQLEYYSQITNNMVGRVLRRRQVVDRKDGEYELLGFGNFSADEVAKLIDACNVRLAEYIESRGAAIWDHRRKSTGYISGTLRYEVLKGAKFRCDLCGVSADEKALEVGHVVPRNRGGTDELANLQALCYSCNSMKRDRDDTDFRLVRVSYENTEEHCPFCSLNDRPVVLENALAVAIEDIYPVTKGHTLILPRRHEPSYFELGSPEIRACSDLISRAKADLVEQDPSILGFNVGINCGEAAGQTIMHCHIHLIPRRRGDHPNPRGGVRGVIPGQADYIANEARQNLV